MLSLTSFQEGLVPSSVYFAVILATPAKDKVKELLCTIFCIKDRKWSMKMVHVKSSCAIVNIIKGKSRPVGLTHIL